MNDGRKHTQREREIIDRAHKMSRKEATADASRAHCILVVGRRANTAPLGMMTRPYDNDDDDVNDDDDMAHTTNIRYLHVGCFVFTVPFVVSFKPLCAYKAHTQIQTNI